MIGDVGQFCLWINIIPDIHYIVFPITIFRLISGHVVINLLDYDRCSACYYFPASEDSPYLLLYLYYVRLNYMMKSFVCQVDKGLLKRYGVIKKQELAGLF